MVLEMKPGQRDARQVPSALECVSSSAKYFDNNSERGHKSEPLKGLEHKLWVWD